MKLKLLILLVLFLGVAGLSMAQPANDNCGNAKEIIIPMGGWALSTFVGSDTVYFYSDTVDMTLATTQIGSGETFRTEISGQALDGRSIWFKFRLPTARRVKVQLDIPNGLAIPTPESVGFTVYKANTCFPGNAERSAAKLTPLPRKGSTLNPCLDAGEYLIQVSSKNNADANGKVFIAISLRPSYDGLSKPDLYDFTTASSGSDIGTFTGKPSDFLQSPQYSIQCHTIENAWEYQCLPTNNRTDFTKSSWHTFRTGTHIDYLKFFLNYVQVADTVGFRLLQGDVRTADQQTLPQIGTCQLLQQESTEMKVTDFLCNLLPNTTYSVQLLFKKDFESINSNLNRINIQLRQVGDSPTLSPVPIASQMNTASKLGVLPRTPAGSTTTLNDFLACNAFLTDPANQCGTVNPPNQVSLGAQNYDLNTWTTFELSEDSNVDFELTVTNGRSNGSLAARIFKKDITETCADLNLVTDLYQTFVQNIFVAPPDLRIKCMPKGKYSLQILGKSNIPALPSGGNLSAKVKLDIKVEEVDPYNEFSLVAPHRYDSINNNLPLVPNVVNNGRDDDFGCLNTPLPMITCGALNTKAMYRIMKIGDGNGDAVLDSGYVVVTGFTRCLDYKFWKGNAKDLVVAQNKFSYPQQFTGLTDYADCVPVGCSAPIPTVYYCVTPGDHTLTTFGDTTDIGLLDHPTIQFKTVSTKHYSRQTAQDLGDITALGGISSDVDYFSCKDNPNPEVSSAVGACVTATKLIYRQFYIAEEKWLTLNYPYPMYGHGGKLFRGKATDLTQFLTSYNYTGKNTSCFTNFNNHPGSNACNLPEKIPAGWYTVVSYGSGQAYDNVSRSGAQGHVGQADQWAITFHAPPAPLDTSKYNRPYKAFRANNGNPVRWQSSNTYEVYPNTGRCYDFGNEYFNCLTDAPLSRFMKDSCKIDATIPNRTSYHEFETDQRSFVVIDRFGNHVVKVYPFHVRTDSVRMLTEEPLQACITGSGFVQLCDLAPGKYTLVLFANNSHINQTVQPRLWIDSVGTSLHDFANKAYDFGLVKANNGLYKGKEGEVNPFVTARAASHDTFTCNTGASATDPTNGLCYIGNINPNIYPNKPNNVLFTQAMTKAQVRRNLVYTWTTGRYGWLTTTVKNVSPNKVCGAANVRYEYAIYKSNVGGLLDFSSLVGTAELDSTLTQGLTFITSNLYGGCNPQETISFERKVPDACFGQDTAKVERYYLFVYQPISASYLNNQVEVYIKYDSLPVNYRPKPKYDHYAHANLINGLNQVSPPYNNLFITSGGIYAGDEDTFQCATFQTSDPTYNNSCTLNKNLWWKVQIPHSGVMRVGYRIKTVGGYGNITYNPRYMIIFKDNDVNIEDSTSVGLQTISSFEDLTISGQNWGQKCYTAGTYYIVMKACDMAYDTAKVIPYIWTELDTVRYDHYSNANRITSLNQIDPPYTSEVLGAGTYKGAPANFRCATTNTPPDQSCLNLGQRDQTIWYYFDTNVTGRIKIRQDINEIASDYSRTQILLFRETKSGDSTATGLKYQFYEPWQNNNAMCQYYLKNDIEGGRTWGETCVYPGRYYIMLNGKAYGSAGINYRVKPVVKLTDQTGDYCTNAVPITLNDMITSVTENVDVTCHTIGEGYGEDGTNMDCLLKPLEGFIAPSEMRKWKTSWFSLDLTVSQKVDVRFKLLPPLPSFASQIRYRVLYGNCGTMTPAPCNDNGLTEFKLDCLGSGRYYIQVTSPSDAVGDISLNVLTTISNDQICKPSDLQKPFANFDYDPDCKTDTVKFTNQSTKGTDIVYDWDFGYNAQFSTAINPTAVYPRLVPNTYHVRLIVKNTTYNKSDTIVEPVYVSQVASSILGSNRTVCGNDTLRAFYKNATYKWDNNTTNPERIVTTTGTYWVDIMTGRCTVRDSTQITVLPVNATITPIIQDCNPTIELRANTEAGLTYQWQRNGTDITGATNFNYFTSIAGTYTVKVSKTTGGVTCGKISAPANPSTWRGNLEVYNDTTLYQDASFFHVNIYPNGTLRIADNVNITVIGNWTNQGTFQARKSTVILPGCTRQRIKGENHFYNLTIRNPNHVDFEGVGSVKRRLFLEDGNLYIENGAYFTLRSNADLTAMVAQKTNGSNAVIGTVTVQRHITGHPSGFTGKGYHYFCSPVAGASYSQVESPTELNPMYVYSDYYWYNYKYVDLATFPNAFYYDALKPKFDLGGALDTLVYGQIYRNPNFNTQGFEGGKPINGILQGGWRCPMKTDLMPLGIGFNLHIETGKTLDFTGTLYNGDLFVTVYRNSDSTYPNSKYLGWNLIGNPYPAPINFGAFYADNSTKIENTLYRRVPLGNLNLVTWTTFKRGAGSVATNPQSYPYQLNISDSLIAVGQAFFVIAKNNNNEVLTFKNTQREQGYSNPTMHRVEKSIRPHLKFALANQEWRDEAIIYFDAAFKTTFDEEDALKIREFGLKNVPQLSMPSADGQETCISGLPTLGNFATVPLILRTTSQEKHRITILEQQNLENHKLFLLDLQDSIETPFLDGQVEIDLKKANNQREIEVKNRFVLLFKRQATEKTSNDDYQIKLYPNPATEILHWETRKIQSGDYVVKVIDVLGRVILEQSFSKKLTEPDQALDIKSIGSGFYTILFEDGRNRYVGKFIKTQ